jgi:hypothetical protein
MGIILLGFMGLLHHKIGIIILTTTKVIQQVLIVSREEVFFNCQIRGKKKQKNGNNHYRKLDVKKSGMTHDDKNNNTKTHLDYYH